MMRKSRFNKVCVSTVAALSLLACYAGMPAVANVTKERYQFRGFTQIAAWFFPEGNAYVQCYENRSGNGQPEGSPTAIVYYNSYTWDGNIGSFVNTSLYAEGPIALNSMNYHQALNQPTRCGFTGLQGTMWIGSSLYGTTTIPVTVTANSLLSAGEVAEGRFMMMETYRAATSMTMVRNSSVGKTGYEITGMGGIAVTDLDGNVRILIPEGTPVVDGNSYNQYVTNGQTTTYKY